MKKTSRQTAKIVVSIIAAALIILSIPFTKYCIIGVNDTFYNAEISVNGNELKGEGSLLSSSGYVSRVGYDYDDGVVTINVYNVLPIIKKNGDFNFDIDYKADGDIKSVQMSDGRVLWEDIDISLTAGVLFRDKVKYVGDNSAVSNLIDDANKKLNYNIREKANTVKGLQMMLDDLDELYGE